MGETLRLMRLSALAAVFGALPLSVSAGAAGIAADLKRTREDLESLEKLPSAEPSQDYKECAAGFSVSKLLDEAPGLPTTMATANKEDILNYLTYRALAQGDPAPCDSLKDPAADPRGAGALSKSDFKLCRARYHEMRFVEEFVGQRPGRTQACVEAQTEGNGMPLPEAREKCVFWEDDFARRYPKVPTTAEIRDYCRTTQKGASAKARMKCAPYTLAFFGDDRECAHAGDGVASARQARYDRLQCRSFAAFARAEQAKDPAACGGLDLCLALKGQPALSSERAAQRLRWVYCGKRRPQDAELSDQIWRTLGDIRASLAPVSAGSAKLSLTPDGLKSLRGEADELEQRYWRVIGAPEDPRKPS